MQLHASDEHAADGNGQQVCSSDQSSVHSGSLWAFSVCKASEAVQLHTTEVSTTYGHTYIQDHVHAYKACNMI